ncbi:hypothetical protein [Paenibacillus ginsengarvi]|uniref:Holliday junction resolvase RuvC n=1 Tax=Paenibacillus ginsengarvi TaxID=400777 RepID=A0A3B0CYT1_9BACL|nr:hypothetical protein [Paenibacillus ginsengarvi]RKN86776.1 hypothetical protein D7M11_02120 [Paenibacillus ginsengarvi]
MRRYIGIDPSTLAGLVELDQDGNVIQAFELQAPKVEEVGLPAELERINWIVEKLEESIFGAGNWGDSINIAIETFAYGAKGKFVAQMYGIGWMLRDALPEYIDVTPTELKKFASGKGTMKKDSLSVEIFKRWGFEHKSDNVRDAYVLAQIARAMHEPVKLTSFQQEIIDALKNPGKPKLRKGKKERVG